LSSNPKKLNKQRLQDLQKVPIFLLQINPKIELVNGNKKEGDWNLVGDSSKFHASKKPCNIDISKEFGCCLQKHFIMFLRQMRHHHTQMGQLRTSMKALISLKIIS
jgi:hypothetical protein